MPRKGARLLPDGSWDLSMCVIPQTPPTSTMAPKTPRAATPTPRKTTASNENEVEGAKSSSSGINRSPLEVRPVPKGKPRDLTPFSWSRRKKSWWYPWFLERLLKRYFKYLFFGWIAFGSAPQAMLMSGFQFFGYAASFASMASYSASTTKDITVAVTSESAMWMKASSQAALSLMSEVWRGIDLMNVTTVLERGSALTDAPREWAEHFALHPPNSTFLSSTDVYKIAEVVKRLRPSSPWQAAEWEHYHTEDYYQAVKIQCGWRSFNAVYIRWQAIRVTYRLQWAHPLWDVMAIPYKRESLQIYERLRNIVKYTSFHPGVHEPFGDETESEVPVFSPFAGISLSTSLNYLPLVRIVSRITSGIWDYLSFAPLHIAPPSS